MSIIIKTPFRSSDLETDPIVYGLRPEELRQGIYQLYNDKSLLITGTRGIGKSSFCYQLQKIIKGDDTLLKRCALEISMPIVRLKSVFWYRWLDIIILSRVANRLILD